MAKRVKPEDYTCEFHFSDGWQQRFTQAFVDLYYERKRLGKEDLQVIVERRQREAAEKAAAEAAS